MAALVVLALAALGGILALTDRVPARPALLHNGMTRRRRGVNVVYPPGVARLAGIALLLYAVAVAMIAANFDIVLSGAPPPSWTGYGGWPLLLGALISIYVMLRLRRPPA